VAAKLRLVECDPRDPAAQACLAAYYAELDRRVPDGFVVEQSHDPDPAQLVRPRGAFILARRGDEAVGCVALKGTCAAYAEIKRLWVSEAARGSGLAARLMERAEAVARELGITVLRLDTHSALANAVAIYRHWGWTEIERYNDDRYAEVFFEKVL
jgi:GNAT superfamily N-acetyltransferase